MTIPISPILIMSTMITVKFGSRPTYQDSWSTVFPYHVNKWSITATDVPTKSLQQEVGRRPVLLSCRPFQVLTWRRRDRLAGSRRGLRRTTMWRWTEEELRGITWRGRWKEEKKEKNWMGVFSFLGVDEGLRWMVWREGEKEGEEEGGGGGKVFSIHRVSEEFKVEAGV